jgi:hypothetical protein
MFSTNSQSTKTIRDILNNTELKKSESDTTSYTIVSNSLSYYAANRIAIQRLQ